MRILLGIDTWGLIGGSERYALQLCAELCSRGHEVGVLCGEIRSDTHSPSETLVHPAYSRERSNPEELDHLERSIRAFRPEILYLLSARGRMAVRRMTRLVAGFPVVRFVQDHTLFCPGLTKMHTDGRNCVEPLGVACLRHYFFEQGCTAFRPELHRSPLDAFGGVWKWKRQLDVARQATRLVVASNYMRAELEAAGIPAHLVERLPLFTLSGTPAAPEREPEERIREFVSAPGAPLVLAPARLSSPEKGLDLLLEAVARTQEPLRLVIAGSGPAESELRQQAATAGLQARVLFTGWQDAATLEWLYARCDFVAFPSMWPEPFGLVGIEAMAHGKAVIAFDVGGVREWLQPERTGILVPRGDVTGLACGLARLARDSELRQTMGTFARADQRELFTPEKHLASLEDLFAGLLGRRR